MDRAYLVYKGLESSITSPCSLTDATIPHILEINVVNSSESQIHIF